MFFFFFFFTVALTLGHFHTARARAAELASSKEVVTNRNIDRSISLYNPCKRNLMTIKQQSSEPSEQGTSKFQEYLEHAIRHKGEEFPDAPQAINRTISNPLDAIQVKSSQLRHKRCTRQSLAYSISLMLRIPKCSTSDL